MLMEHIGWNAPHHVARHQMCSGLMLEWCMIQVSLNMGVSCLTET